MATNAAMTDSECAPLSEPEQLFHIRKHAMLMLQRRGYAVTDEDLGLTLEQFTKQFGESPERDDLSFSVPRVDDLDDRLLVAFAADPKFGVTHTKALMEVAQSNSTSRVVLILRDKLTPFAKLAIAQLAPRFVVEPFLEHELLIDLLAFSLVPRHELLEEEEVQPVLDLYRTTRMQLPRIALDDPLSRYFGARRGDVFKITRATEDGSRFLYYRVVV